MQKPIYIGVLLFFLLNLPCKSKKTDNFERFFLFASSGSYVLDNITTEQIKLPFIKFSLKLERYIKDSVKKNVLRGLIPESVFKITITELTLK